MKCLLLLSFPLLINGCSIYRSEGRKQFESEAPNKVSVNSVPVLFQPKNCKKIGSLETWFKEEFPAQNYELIIAKDDFEVWLEYKETSMEVTAIQKNNSFKNKSCVFEFNNENEWDLYKDIFLQHVEDNLTIIE